MHKKKTATQDSQVNAKKILVVRSKVFANAIAMYYFEFNSFIKHIIKFIESIYVNRIRQNSFSEK